MKLRFPLLQAQCSGVQPHQSLANFGSAPWDISWRALLKSPLSHAGISSLSILPGTAVEGALMSSAIGARKWAGSRDCLAVYLLSQVTPLLVLLAIRKSIPEYITLSLYVCAPALTAHRTEL